ncbi:beta-lactamase family protein [Luminiphilus sp.]|nr:serine hydrolase domain-containing protein [Luminiphilus sp.]MDA8985988.1 beta-lactamase family protein [Luminiphilus sp.]
MMRSLLAMLCHVESMKTTVLLCLLLLVAPLQAEERANLNPEAVGFSSARLSKVSEFVDREILAGRLAGAVTVIARHGEIVHFESAGRYGLDDDRPLDTDALFRIFSMTKPITTVAAMILYEEGAFHLGEPVAKYLPALEGMSLLVDGQLVAPNNTMTIEQLMTHTAGLTNGWHVEHPVERAYRDAALQNSPDLDAFIKTLGTLPLRFEPGTRYHYSVATDVLGALVERLSGQTLEQFFHERIFEPLGMRDTYFNVPAEKTDRLARNHLWDAERQQIMPMPDGLIPPTSGVSLFSGGGGLISTAKDYWRFCEMLRRGGHLEGVRILGPKTVQAMTMARLTPEVRDNGATEYPASHLYPGQSYGLGFGVITDPAQSQVISSQGEYSWGGIANTKFWIDAEEDLVVILMTQVIGAPYSDRLRFDLKVATYQALSTLGASSP